MEDENSTPQMLLLSHHAGGEKLTLVFPVVTGSGLVISAGSALRASNEAGLLDQSVAISPAGDKTGQHGPWPLEYSRRRAIG